MPKFLSEAAERRIGIGIAIGIRESNTTKDRIADCDPIAIPIPTIT